MRFRVSKEFCIEKEDRHQMLRFEEIFQQQNSYIYRKNRWMFRQRQQVLKIFEVYLVLTKERKHDIQCYMTNSMISTRSRLIFNPSKT
jgi:hypothetical protein